jgi:hypothetical protein
MNDVTTAHALLPVYNLWYVATQDGSDVRTVRRLEANLWAKVAEHGLLIATDEILVGRWIADTVGGRIDLGSGVKSFPECAASPPTGMASQNSPE